MKLSQLLRDVEAAVPQGAEELDICGITCDSRRVAPGWLFVCIRGAAADGHRFAAAAVEAGAAAVMTETALGLPCELSVSSTRTAWAQLCANWFGRPAERLRMVGITGTNGKTTVSYMIKTVLETFGCKVGLIGTIQNMIGERVLPSGHTTPDPYDLQSMLSLMVAEGCAYAVMEVSSHALDQERVGGCRFDAAVFTNLTQDHLDYHLTMENYLQAKKKLFRQCEVAVVNADDPAAAALTEGLTCRRVTYALRQSDADDRADRVRPRPDGVDFDWCAADEQAAIRLAIPGTFSVYNALAAGTCACALGLPLAGVAEALCRVHGVKGRAEVVPTGREFTTVIDYAHTPDALDNICHTLKEGCAGRLITLFGCGGDRDRTKRPKMAAAAAAGSDHVIVTSDNPRSEDPQAIIEDILPGLQGTSTPYTVIPDRREAICRALEIARSGDVVLLAGKGHETYQVLRDGVIHFDEREVIAEALGQ